MFVGTFDCRFDQDKFLAIHDLLLSFNTGVFARRRAAGNEEDYRVLGRSARRQRGTCNCSCTSPAFRSELFQELNWKQVGSGIITTNLDSPVPSTVSHF